MEISVEACRWQADSDGQWLCLKTRDARRACDEMAVGKTYSVSIKQQKKKRSMDANNYFWKLLDELSAKLGATKESLYLQYVRNCGPFKDFVLTEEEAKTFRVAWSMLGTGWPTEQVDFDKDGDRRVIRAYYGSSTYNTKQMSRLIDSVVEDCKEQGIETMTPFELDGLKERWK